jgi:hypothetical protein
MVVSSQSTPANTARRLRISTTGAAVKNAARPGADDYRSVGDMRRRHDPRRRDHHRGVADT